MFNANIMQSSCHMYDNGAESIECEAASKTVEIKLPEEGLYGGLFGSPFPAASE